MNLGLFSSLTRAVIRGVSFTQALVIDEALACHSGVSDYERYAMGDGTYKTSIVKKTMIFLALRKTHSKTIGEAVRGVRKALKEGEQPVARKTGEKEHNTN
jgi:hypothetical protein